MFLHAKSACFFSQLLLVVIVCSMGTRKISKVNAKASELQSFYVILLLRCIPYAIFIGNNYARIDDLLQAKFRAELVGKRFFSKKSLYPHYEKAFWKKAIH